MPGDDTYAGRIAYLLKFLACDEPCRERGYIPPCQGFVLDLSILFTSECILDLASHDIPLLGICIEFILFLVHPVIIGVRW